MSSATTATRPLTWQTALARARLPLVLGGAAMLFLGDSAGIPRLVRIVLFLGILAIYLRAGTVRREPTEVAPPIKGRWLAINSPANRVPSHGSQAYGQTYAVDLVHEPEAGDRPPFGWWPFARRPDEFPAFGRPIFAASDGVVVRAHSRERDHWSRNSWPALPYMLLPEAAVRELTGPGRILGNHLILDCGDGTYAAYAHLQRDSLQVEKGDRVQAGQHIANCGNSGNSSEPHLHFQLMDHRNVFFAAGVPFSFTHFEADGGPQSGVPPANQPFVATPAAT